LDNGLSGALEAPSAYFKKSPPVQYTDDEARKKTDEFILKYGWKKPVMSKHKLTLKSKSSESLATTRKTGISGKTKTKVSRKTLLKK